MFRAARVASRASKNSWSFEAFTCFQFTAEHGSSYRSTTICPAVQNMGKINDFLGHKTRRQAKRIYYYFFCKSYPLKGTRTNSTEYYCFTWKKLGPLQSFVVTSQKSPPKKKCGHSSRYSPSPPPYSLTFALVSMCTQSRMWSWALINIPA